MSSNYEELYLQEKNTRENLELIDTLRTRQRKYLSLLFLNYLSITPFIVMSVSYSKDPMVALGIEMVGIIVLTIAAARAIDPINMEIAIRTKKIK